MGAIATHCCLFFLVVFCEGLPVEKRSILDKPLDDYPDYLLGVRYDEYPLIVPKKRTALLVNRLMMALKQAINEDDEEDLRNTDILNNFQQRPGRNYQIPADDIRAMDLQRRGPSNMGQQKGRTNYWRCYFNAVTCF